MQKINQNNQKTNIPQMHNAHDFLNFVKKSNKKQCQLYSRSLQSNKMILSSVLQINNNNRNVFGVKLSRYESVEHNQRYKIPHHSHPQVSYHTQDFTLINKEMIQRKNRQIQQSIGKQRQKMSDIIYNFSQFRAIQHNHYRIDKKEKLKKKSYKIPRQPQIQALQFPKIIKSTNEIFTIDYDNQGNKFIKMHFGHQQQNCRKVKQSDDINRLPKLQEMQEISKKQPIYKKKKQQMQFGIQIKSIVHNPKTKVQIQYQNYLKTMMNQMPQKSFKGKQYANLNLRKEESQQNSTSKKQVYRQIYQLDEELGINQPESNIIISKTQIIKSDDRKQNKIVSSLANLQINSEEIQKEQNKEKQIVNPSKRQKKHIYQVCVDKQITFYDIKINLYRQFLFMINLSHHKFDPLILKDSSTLKTQQKYKFYVGKGNNSLLVKGIFSRRFWWVEQQDYKKSNCVWTQLKINQFYQQQNKCLHKYEYKCENERTYKDNQKMKKKLAYQQKNTPKYSYKAPLPKDKDKIFTTYDNNIYQAYQNNITNNDLVQKMLKYTNRLKYFQPKLLSKTKQQKYQQKMHNHLQFNHFIGNKKALFYNLKAYYTLLKKNVFEIIPLTFHIKNSPKDPQYQHFISQFKKIQNLKALEKYKIKEQQGQTSKKKKIKNIWIVKPGELSNRGNGIVVINQLNQLHQILKSKEKHKDGNYKTYIIQKYIQNPLLYKGRKFDIRHYMIITKLHGIQRAYWYGQGYIRTSSYDFDLEDADQMIHLTNDAIQKHSTFYGKHEEGNKLSYSQFQKYLDGKYGEGKYSFAQNFYPKMKSIATDAVKSCFHLLDPNHLQHNFEIFGLDFMIDDNFNVWLIEVNTNPCLQLSSKLLARIIPNMLQQAFRLSVDVIFPPTSHYPNCQKYSVPDHPLDRLMYELIFDSARDGKQLNQLYNNSQQIDYGGQIKEDDEIYQNQGKQLQLNID